jgi:hypothetical protein
LRLRFPHGAPSLVEAKSLHVQGDVHFGRNISVHGAVAVTNPGPDALYIPDATLLTEST